MLFYGEKNMLKHGKVIIFAIIVISLCSFLTLHLRENSLFHEKIKPSPPLPYRQDEFKQNNYSVIIHQLCHQELFDERDAYDSCHYLMVPMYFAFINYLSDEMDSFDTLFNHFCASDRGEFNKKLSGLNKNHWYYLATEYLCLCVKFQRPVNKELLRIVADGMVQYNIEHTTNWIHLKKFNNMQDLLENLAFGNGYATKNSMSNIITDNELFPLAILCDLNYVTTATGIKTNADSLSQWATQFVKRMMRKHAVYIDEDSWIFQLGCWADHPDYAYTGYKSINDVKPKIKKIVVNIAQDSSHYSRWPCFIRSFFRNDSKLYEKYKKGIANLLINKVIVNDASGYYIVNNFMDGNNGVFRYNKAKMVGYGPYQMSTTFLLGWWSLLDDARISSIYAKLYRRLKFLKEMPDEYRDPVTSRKQNPIFIDFNYYKMLVYMASMISAESFY